MKTTLKILSILILIAVATGFFFKFQDDHLLGDRIIGVSVLATAFVLLPLWLAYSWKGKRLQDYTLTNENIKKIREKNEREKGRNKF